MWLGSDTPGQTGRPGVRLGLLQDHCRPLVKPTGGSKCNVPISVLGWVTTCGARGADTHPGECGWEAKMLNRFLLYFFIHV